MRLSVPTWAVLMVVGLLLAAGCGTMSRSLGGKHSRGSAERPDDSPEAVERRIEAHARYASGVIHDLNEHTEEAVSDYVRAGQLDSGNERLILDITKRLLQLQKNEQALELLQASSERPTASGALFTRMAAVYGLMGQTNKAVAAAQVAMKRDPESSLPYQHLAQIYIQQGHYEQALKVLRGAADKSRLSSESMVAIAELCLATVALKPGDREILHSMADELLTDAVAQKPTNPLLLQRMADGYLFLNKAEQASDLYLSLLERFPHLPGLRERLVEIYLQQQDLTKASQQLESVLQSNPTNIRAHYLLGSVAYDGRDMDKARDHFEKVILLNPDFEQAYYDLAGALISLGEPRAALDRLDTVRNKFKVGFLAELYSALAYSRLEEYPKAVRHFEAAEIIARATDTNRLNHVFYFQLGAAYERNKQFGDAERYFRKCLEMSPDFSEALNYLGYMWAERDENLQEARVMIEKAVQLEPDNAAYLDSLGWVLYKLDQPQKALEYMLRALELMEEPDPVLFDHIGDIYAALNEEDKARDAWGKSLELEPSDAIRAKLDAVGGPR